MAEQPDLTLDEIVAAIRKQRILAAAAPCSAPLSARMSPQRSLPGPSGIEWILPKRRRRMRQQGLFDPARLVFIEETATGTNMVRLKGRCRVASAQLIREVIGEVPQGRWETLTLVAGKSYVRFTVPRPASLPSTESRISAGAPGFAMAVSTSISRLPEAILSLDRTEVRSISIMLHS